MSKKLSQLLDQPEALVEAAIKKLEYLNGYESTDIRLLAEVNNKMRAKTKELGLDPDDTTGPELYHALLVKLAQDEEKLSLNSDELIEKVIQVHKSHKVYALKHSVAKELLRAHPPRKLMKQLNYRSVDSLLKRENIALLYDSLPLVESSRWLNIFWKDLVKLTSSDFESQNIEIVSMPIKYKISLNVNKNVTSLTLLGTVVVWPNTLSKVGVSLELAQNINHLRVMCAYIKLRQVEADFGKTLVQTLQNDIDNPLEISHMPIGWKTIFHHYGKRKARDHTEFFGPHLLHEDIKAHYPLKTLAKISPTFSWWKDLEHVMKKSEEGLVSLNLADVIASHDKPYDQRSIKHARESLWHKFIDKYLDHPSIEQHFMQQLDPQTVPIEELRFSPEPEEEIQNLIEVGV